jgi:DNA-binding transcriptional ArsR family regulator
MSGSGGRRRGRPGRAAADGALMTTGALDPLIHSPARLRIVGTLAALPGGDALSVARLQHLTGLDPGRMMAGLGTLAGAGYVQTDKAGDGAGTRTTLALTRDGRAAVDRYIAGLRSVPAGLPRAERRRPRPDLRIGDADRDATAAALGEHFARGRLTLDELDARLGAAFTAVTQRELSRATCDLPEPGT